jgi:co-chaperonin GroES (HSP10)
MISNTLYDRVLVLEVENQHDTFITEGPAGILLKSNDEEAQDGVRRAKVVSIGPDTVNVKVGMNICWRRTTTGRPVTIDGLTYIMLREDEIEGFFEN